MVVLAISISIEPNNIVKLEINFINTKFKYKAHLAKTSKPLTFLSLGGWWLRFLSFGQQFELLVQLL